MLGPQIRFSDFICAPARRRLKRVREGFNSGGVHRLHLFNQGQDPRQLCGQHWDLGRLKGESSQTGKGLDLCFSEHEVLVLFIDQERIFVNIPGLPNAGPAAKLGRVSEPVRHSSDAPPTTLRADRASAASLSRSFPISGLTSHHRTRMAVHRR